MKTSDVFLIVFAVIFTVLLVWSIVDITKTRRRLRRETVSVSVLRNMKTVKKTLVCACISAVLSCMLVLFDLDDIRDIKSGVKDRDYYPYSKTETLEEYRARILDKSASHCKLWGMTCAGWTLTAVFRAIEMKKGRYAHITEKNVYLHSYRCPAEKYSYKLNGKTLLLYYKNYSTPAEYTMIEDMERLKQMLAENYKPYQEI